MTYISILKEVSYFEKMLDFNLKKDTIISMLLNYDQCVEIVKKNQNFFEKTVWVDGYKISIFDYILSSYDLFNQPIENSPLKAFEVRGLTFVHDHNTGTIKRNLHLTKFFNLNENPDYQADKLRGRKILRIQTKLDGSMIRFFETPARNIYAKTRAGHTNDQSVMANEWFKRNPKAQEFIRESLDQDLAAIFELTSPLNKIVCDYTQTDCQLLQLRDEITGEYLDIYNHPLVLKYKNDIKITDSLPLMDIDQLLEYKKTAVNIEGAVATLDNTLFKVKTDWYMERFRVRSALEVEDSLISMIIDEQLDDAIALLSDDNPYKIMSIDIQKVILNHLLDEKKKAMDFFDVFVTKYNRVPKDFSLAHPVKDQYFGFIANFFKSDQVDEVALMSNIKKHVKFKTRRLKMAQDYLKDLGYKKPLNLPQNDS